MAERQPRALEPGFRLSALLSGRRPSARARDYPPASPGRAFPAPATGVVLRRLPIQENGDGQGFKESSTNNVVFRSAKERPFAERKATKPRSCPWTRPKLHSFGSPRVGHRWQMLPRLLKICTACRTCLQRDALQPASPRQQSRRASCRCFGTWIAALRDRLAAADSCPEHLGGGASSSDSFPGITAV